MNDLKLCITKYQFFPQPKVTSIFLFKSTSVQKVHNFNLEDMTVLDGPFELRQI
jgi:hypothetical protein